MASERGAFSTAAEISALKERLRQNREVSLDERSLERLTLREDSVDESGIAREPPPATTEGVGENQELPSNLDNERKHAGDVARRNSSATQALPPPKTEPRSNPQDARKRPGRKDQKGKRGKGLGDDSDDDSEEERGQRKEDQDAPTDRKKKTVAATQRMPTSSSSGLTEEEQERLRLGRVLRRAEDRWLSFQAERAYWSQERREQESSLLKGFVVGPALQHDNKDTSGNDHNFIDSAENPSEVFEPEFKAGTIAKMVRVPTETLSSLGWRRDKTTDRYWRLTPSLFWNNINLGFKEQMNGQIVGISYPLYFISHAGQGSE